MTDDGLRPPKQKAVEPRLGVWSAFGLVIGSQAIAGLVLFGGFFDLGDRARGWTYCAVTLAFAAGVGWFSTSPDRWKDRIVRTVLLAWFSLAASGFAVRLFG